MPLTKKDLLGISKTGIAAGASAHNPYAEGDEARTTEKLKDFLAGQRSDKNMQTAQSYMDDNSAKGRKVGVSIGQGGTVSLSQNEPNPYMQQSKMEASQSQKLYTEAKKAATPVEGQLQAMSMMHQLLDNPNSVDQKQMGALQARLTEGNGQRLLQSLVESLGAPSSVSGDATQSSNFLFGMAKSGFTADQVNAIRQNLFKHQAEVEGSLNDGKQQFLQGASLIAPNLGVDKHQQAINAASMHADNLLQQLNQRRDAFQKQSGTQVPAAQMPPQQAQPNNIIDKGLSGLGNFFSKLSSTGGQAAPQQQQQQAPAKPKTVMQNGHTYTLNPTSGQYE